MKDSAELEIFLELRETSIAGALKTDTSVLGQVFASASISLVPIKQSEPDAAVEPRNEILAWNVLSYFSSLHLLIDSILYYTT